uniref:Secreted protein n=1 Tax=Globodera rostochiensis TaxID=31243 RepID=A0A914I0B6_GLORO
MFVYQSLPTILIAIFFKHNNLALVLGSVMMHDLKEARSAECKAAIETRKSYSISNEPCGNKTSSSIQTLKRPKKDTTPSRITHL